MITLRTLLRSAPLAVAAAIAAAPLGAQAWNYPAFQLPYANTHEVLGGIAAGGDAGTSYFGQYRDVTTTSLGYSFDVAGVSGDNFSRFGLGAGLVKQFASASAQQPLDFAFTAGAYASFGDNATILRVPVGVSLGRRVPLDGGLTVVPYAHPRLSIDVCGSGCDDGVAGNDNNTEVNFVLDLGADLEMSPNLSLRGALSFGGVQRINDSAFGLGLAYRPGGLHPSR